jgi:hypothetical protein
MHAFFAEGDPDLALGLLHDALLFFLYGYDSLFHVIPLLWY